ncbi:MAG: 4-(cytidine 5'-diphospho)-2-C-methyl-D-erythritol kinase, partial [Tistlia sp.]
NDLEAPARRLCPEIDAVLGALAATPGCLLGRMSGSGATCFGLYATAAEAREAAAAIAADRPAWWAAAAPILGTAE